MSEVVIGMTIKELRFFKAYLIFAAIFRPDLLSGSS